jgi:hypothetical protein
MRVCTSKAKTADEETKIEKQKMKIKDLEIGTKYQKADDSSIWIKTGKTVSKRFGTTQPSIRHDRRINCVVVK